MIHDLNGEYSPEEKRGLWEKLKHTLKDALQLSIDVADEMKADAEYWEQEEQAERLQTPATGQECRHET